MKNTFLFTLIFLPFVAFSQIDSLEYGVLSSNDSTFIIIADYGKELGSMKIQVKTKDKGEIDSLKKRLVPYRFKGLFNYDKILANAKIEKQKRDSTLATLVNAPIPDFDAPDTTGFVHRLKSYQGRVLILHFWNFWDQSFQSELPVLNKIIEKYRGDGLAVLSFTDISIGKDEKELLVKHPVNFPIIPNSRDFFSKLFPRVYYSTPSLVLIDKQGKTRYLYIDNELGDKKSDFYKAFKEENVGVGFEAKIRTLLHGQ